MRIIKLSISVISIVLITSSLNAQPSQEWVKNFNGQSNLWDQGKQIVQLSDGNIAVAGNMINFSTETAVYFDTQILKMNTNGDTLWTRTINIGDFYRDEIVKMLTDEIGNIYLAVNSESQGITTMEFLKYNLNGEQIWHSTFQKQDTTCSIADMVLDNDNNIIVAGSVGIITFSDIYLLKYDNDGNLINTDVYTSAETIFRTAISLAVDNNNNYYIGGHQTINDVNNSYTDMLLVKFNSNGDQIWNKIYDGPANWFDFTTVLKIDNDDNIYLAGFSEEEYDGAPDGNFVLLKYNPQGDTLWTARYDGGFGGDWPVAMVIDNSNNCYLTGWTLSENGKSTTVLKYSPSGNLEWTYTYDGVGYYFNDPYDIGLFPNGNILIIGATQPDEFPTDWNLICLTSEGEELWRKTFTGNGTTNQWNLPLQLLIVSNSEFYVIGFADINTNDSDMLVAKYSVSCFNPFITSPRLHVQFPNSILFCDENDSEILSTQTYDTYQWYKQEWTLEQPNPNPWVAITGANSQTHSINTTDDMLYYFKVTATLGECTEESPEILADGFTYGLPFMIINFETGTFEQIGLLEYNVCNGASVLFEQGFPLLYGVHTWYMCEPSNIPPVEGDPCIISGVTGDSYTATTSGNYGFYSCTEYCPNVCEFLGMPGFIKLNFGDWSFCGTGIENPIKSNNLSLYPNPTTQLLFLGKAEDVLYTNVLITDMSGKVVLMIDNLDYGQPINVSHLASGSYTIISKSKSGKIFRNKFIKIAN